MPHRSSSSLPPVPAIEWPTIGLCLVIYGGWAGLTFFHSSLPWPLLALGGGWIIAWQMSLQHELLHGHPTRIRAVNDALGFPPLTLWLPYQIYRLSHLRHHRDAHLTDPLEDPETYYLTEARFGRLGPLARASLRFSHTFFGRITFGALRSVILFLWAHGRACLRGNRAELRLWLPHLAGVVVVLAWVIGICHMSLWLYVGCFVIPGRILASIRSFAEHRAAPTEAERTAIVENASVLGLLFLYNNLHAVHHDAPGMPWYRIPAFYRAHRDEIVRANGGLVYDGYWDVMRRYLVNPHHRGPHPGFAVPRAPLPGTRRHVATVPVRAVGAGD
ncbi:MAG TPA: fatty acid desaturase [Acidisoma sp.]|jgi:fatty acid desaturase|nr:fatty acid desaturase [Acidisoma sp.]